MSEAAVDGHTGSPAYGFPAEVPTAVGVGMPADLAGPNARLGRRRPILVHIGMTKTGSTSIQHMLATYRNRLARIGIHVPVAGTNEGEPGSHDMLVREALNRGPIPRGGWSELLDEIRASPARRFVLTAERFSTVHGRCIPPIGVLATVANLDVSVLAYVPAPSATAVCPSLPRRDAHGHGALRGRERPLRP